MQNTCVFSAQHMAQVQLVRDLLDQAKVAYEVKGEHRAGLGGELPLDQSRIEVWVSTEVADEARQLINEADFEADIGDAWKTGPG